MKRFGFEGFRVFDDKVWIDLLFLDLLFLYLCGINVVEMYMINVIVVLFSKV